MAREFAGFGLVETPCRIRADCFTALILQGVSTSPNPANSRAIIAADGGQSESYAIGDTVAPGQILSGISTDHVSLAVGGETLSLGFPADAAAPRGADAAPAGSTRLQNLIPAADPVPDGPAGMIKALREEVQRNPQRVLDRYGITATGQGYLIGQSTPADLLQVGLQPGDLVTDLNGHKVGSILADRSFLDEVAASGQAQIVVLRAGKPVALSVPFQ